MKVEPLHSLMVIEYEIVETHRIKVFTHLTLKPIFSIIDQRKFHVDLFSCQKCETSHNANKMLLEINLSGMNVFYTGLIQAFRTFRK